MSREVGMVVGVAEEWVEIKVRAAEGCGQCASEAACMFLGPEAAYQRVRVPRASAAPGVRKGERVTVEVPDSARNVSVGVAFVLPVVLVLVGVVVVQRLPSALIGTIAGGVVTYVAALLAADRWVNRAARFQPRIIEPSVPTDYPLGT